MLISFILAVLSSYWLLRIILFLSFDSICGFVSDSWIIILFAGVDTVVFDPVITISLSIYVRSVVFARYSFNSSSPLFFAWRMGKVRRLPYLFTKVILSLSSSRRISDLSVKLACNILLLNLNTIASCVLIHFLMYTESRADFAHAFLPSAKFTPSCL